MIRWVSSGDFRRAELPNGIRLFVRRAPRFKTVLAKAYLRTPVGFRTTEMALISSVLRRGSRRFPTEMQLRRELDRLYGARLDLDVGRHAAWMALEASLELPCGRFVGAKARPDPYLLEGFHLLRDVLADPLTEAGLGTAFRADYVEQEKRNLAVAIRSLYDQKDAYAFHQCRRLMCGKHPYAVHRYGRLEDLAALRPDGLYRTYREVLSAAPFDLYVLGPVVPDDVYRAAARALAFPRRERSLGPECSAPKPPAAFRRKREPDAVAQGKLVLGYATGIGPGHPLADALAVGSAVLGGFPHSKLFMEVREKSALCYSVSSWADRPTGFVYVSAGLETRNVAKALAVIDREIGAMRRGEVSPGEWSDTIRGLEQQTVRLKDTRGSQAEFHYDETLLARPMRIDQMLRRLRRVTPRQVRAAFGRLKPKAMVVLGPKP